MKVKMKSNDHDHYQFEGRREGMEKGEIKTFRS